MTSKELYKRISKLRTLLDSAIHIKDEGVAMNEKILALSQELDELIVKYVRMAAEERLGKSTHNAHP